MNLLDKETITVLLADDHSLIRQGIMLILEEIEVDAKVTQASNLQQITEQISANKIDIAVIDAHFPDGNSITILPEIKALAPEIRILIFTGIDEAANALKFLKAGANGFISKMSEEEEIKNAILTIMKDGEYLSPQTQSLLMNSMRNSKAINPLFRLTERELQIAKMYASGNGNLEIANELDVKQNTVSTIKRRIFEKLEIENIVELIQILQDNP